MKKDNKSAANTKLNKFLLSTPYRDLQGKRFSCVRLSDSEMQEYMLSLVDCRIGDDDKAYLYYTLVGLKDGNRFLNPHGVFECAEFFNAEDIKEIFWNVGYNCNPKWRLSE